MSAQELAFRAGACSEEEESMREAGERAQGDEEAEEAPNLAVK